MTFDQMLSALPQQLVYGFTLGSVYALIALGYTMVYGILFMINFAHGDVFMVSSFLAWGVITFVSSTGILPMNPFILVPLMLVVAMFGAAVLGITIERLAYRPLYAKGASRLGPMISAIGVSLLLQNLVLLFQLAFMQGPRTRVFPTSVLFPPEWRLHIGGVTVTYLAISIIAASLLLMFALNYLVQNTKIGKAMRAVCFDREASRMMGINIDRTVAITFFLGSAMGGAAGVLVGLYYTQIDLYIGYFVGLKAFTAAVLGGIGNIKGAMLGGLLLGVIESVAVTFVNPAYKDMIAFVVLILLLVLKPAGLLGTIVPQQTKS
ncbi:MAG: branched-chain amino acid ABC transporter permease [Chloroflexota bacterium]